MRPEDAVGMMSDIRKRSDEQARQRLVEIALEVARVPDPMVQALADPFTCRERAGFKNPATGSWCAAGLTAAMDKAGLLVPAPGTPARRGAIALLEWVQDLKHSSLVADLRLQDANPGDIIAWKQKREPQEWSGGHAFATQASAHSLCGMHRMNLGLGSNTKRCTSCVWETRKGHVAVIVATDSESITTVGWNEGASPGRVMTRRLWRDPEHEIPQPSNPALRHDGYTRAPWPHETVLWRRPGGLYGIARPVAA